MSQSQRPQIEKDGVIIGTTKHLFVDPVYAVLKKVQKLGLDYESENQKEFEGKMVVLFENFMNDDAFEEKWDAYIELIFGKKIEELRLGNLKRSEVAKIIANFIVLDSPTENPKDGAQPS